LTAGRIVKNYNGYYYVDCGGTLWPCKLRGRLKKERFSLLTGDLVEIALPAGTGEGSIEAILARKNHLDKPAVANVDQIALVFAVRDPEFNSKILDRFLLFAEQPAVPVIICLSKTDLLPGSVDMLAAYGQLGYPIIPVSIIDHTGIERLRQLLAGKVTVFAGLSGAGKSSLLNALAPDLFLATGAVSGKIGRGRHTTRFSQLLPACGGHIIDTPGFTLVETAGLTAGEIAAAFREFVPYRTDCRFATCTHVAEPGCAVKSAVAAGGISAARYGSYRELLQEAQAHAQKRFR
jgi:ribosome biogenesis GTPase